MDIDIVSQLVSSVGFPIAVCAYLLYDSRRMGQVISGLSEIITKNTLVLEELRRDIDEIKSTFDK